MMALPLPHTPGTRRGRARARLTHLFLVGAWSPKDHQCTAAGSRQTAAATFAWTARKDRAAATLHPAGTTPHHPSCHRPGANPRPRTEISLGARAYTNQPTAPTSRKNLTNWRHQTKPPRAQA